METQHDLANDSFSNVPYWATRYTKGLTNWQLPHPHPKLVKHLNLLTDGGRNKHIFVPLCGKSKDLPYLLSHGHRVFGIEAVPQAIEEFQSENDLKVEFDSTNSVYSTADGNLKIFHGNFWDCPVQDFGPFDAIWDRGSFGSFQFSERGEYLNKMKSSVLDPTGGYRHFKYMLQTYEYDRSLFGGPPTCVDKSDMESLFSSWLDVREIDRTKQDIKPSLPDGPAQFPDPTWELTFLMEPSKSPLLGQIV